MKKQPYGGWPNCIHLSNGGIELVATTDVGPRVIRFGFVGGQNLLKEMPDHMGKTGGDEWRLFGGHRLWHAPEAAPRTYAPDNEPVEYQWDGATLRLSQPVEPTTGIKKDIAITLSPDKNEVRLVHTLTNRGLWDIQVSPWCLTVMAPGGRAVFPQEEYRSHPEYLLPARPLVLWHYTDMSDPRWTWSEKYIQLRQDPDAKTKQKAGILNKQGWAAYTLNGDIFVKRYPYQPDVAYPDYGCNTEAYTDAAILEVETLGPLASLAAEGGSVTQTEHWYLFQGEIGSDDAAIDASLMPLVNQTTPVE